MNDDEIIQQRVSGLGVRGIARTFGVTAAEVSAVLDRFATATIDDKVRKHTLALELARLDELQETFYAGLRKAMCRAWDIEYLGAIRQTSASGRRDILRRPAISLMGYSGIGVMTHS